MGGTPWLTTTQWDVWLACEARARLQLSDLDRLNVIHVTGTKGKGSTCAFVEAALRRCGLRTGLFTSPHLIEVRERIRINGEPLSREAFAKYYYDTEARLLANQVRPRRAAWPLFWSPC